MVTPNAAACERNLLGGLEQSVALSVCRIDLFSIDAQFFEAFHRPLGVKLAIARQPRQGGDGDRFRVDLEMTSQMLAIVAASKAVGAQRHQPAKQPRRQLVGYCFHEVGGGNDGAVGTVERGEDVRPFLRIGGMQPVPTLDGQRVAVRCSW